MTGRMYPPNPGYPPRKAPRFSQAGLGSLTDRQAFALMDAASGPETAPVGSVVRTEAGALWTRLSSGQWGRLTYLHGAVASEVAGTVIYRATSSGAGGSDRG